METQHSHHTTKQIVELKPKLNGFLISYIIFSIPGFVVGLIGMVLTVILLFFVVFGIFLGADSSDTQTLPYRVVKEGKTTNSILIYDLSGPITTGTLTGSGVTRESNIYTKVVASDFAEIKKDKNIKGVVFRVNTPGGEASASKVLGDLIQDLSSFYGQSQSVYYFDSIAASGGLMAAYKSDNYIVGSPYGETGSIGVILTLPNFKGAADKIGYSQTVIKSSETKDIGSSFRDPTDIEIKYFQDSVNKEFATFKETVVSGRKIEPKEVDKIANGFVYTNDRALELGLIDQLGDVEVAVNKTASNNRLNSDYQVLEIKNEVNFVDSLFASKTLSNIFNATAATSNVVNRATFFKPGNLYMVDEYKL